MYNKSVSYKSEKAISESQIHCFKCPLNNICHALCKDMNDLISDGSMERAEKNEILLDPQQLDRIADDRSLLKQYYPSSDKFIKSKNIIITFIFEYMNTMTNSQKRALYLYYYEGLGESDIGKIMNISQPAINMSKVAGIKKIRKYLSHFGLC